MIPNSDQVQAIGKLQHGDLEEIPYAVLLHALAVKERSVVLELERKPMQKKIILENGVPVDCRSNLLHETLGRFMVTQGHLSEEEYQGCMAKSASHGLPFGEVMILDGLITASDLFKILQQNLAKKLLDPFTWQTGTFRIHEDLPKVESALKVKTPQLVVTGISKFAGDEEVNSSIGSLVGKALYLHPSPPHLLSEIHLSPQQKALARVLAEGKRIDELAAETSIPFDQIMRLIYSLAILGIVVPEDRLPKGEKALPPPVAPDEATPEAEVAAGAADSKERRNEVLEAYLKYRKQDAFDLLGVEETGSMEDFQRQYLAFSKKYAPWSFSSRDLREKAEDLFLAAGMAFGELCDVERRNGLIQRRTVLRQGEKKKADPERFAIKSELLDSELQFKKGKALMKAGKYHEARVQLQFAFDCDAQNSTYRAELAYCRYLESPATEAADALAELKEAIRIEPKNGVAHLYTGEVLGQLEDFDEAASYLKRAIKLMAPDRRPIEALKALEAKGKAKKSKKSLLGFGGG